MRGKLFFITGLICLLGWTGCAGQRGYNNEDNTKAPRAERGYLKRQINELMYGYYDPLDTEHYGNVFRMTDGRIMAIILSPQSRNGVYSGDKIGIAELTEENDVQIYALPIGGAEDTFRCKDYRPMDISFVTEGKRVTHVMLTDYQGLYAVVSIDGLYRWRSQKGEWSSQVGDKTFQCCRTVGGERGTDGGWLFFSEEATQAYLDPAANRVSFYPTYFAILTRKENGQFVKQDNIWLGNSGYKLVASNDSYTVEPAQ